MYTHTAFSRAPVTHTDIHMKLQEMHEFLSGCLRSQSPTRRLRLTVVPHVIQAFTHQRKAPVSSLRMAIEHDVWLADASSPGSNRTLPVHLDCNISYTATMLKGNGRRVAPAA